MSAESLAGSFTELYASLRFAGVPSCGGGWVARCLPSAMHDYLLTVLGKSSELVKVRQLRLAEKGNDDARWEQGQ
ncbi:MAG: hypothetical protein ACRDHX_09510, partial [Chloroflexota bacterium]